MKLKRVSDRQTHSTATISNKAKKSDAMIAKFAGGLCFAFHPNDSNMYVHSDNYYYYYYYYIRLTASLPGQRG